jgi:hypothetical protein
MREESLAKKGLVDYNVGVFQNAIASVFDRARLPDAPAQHQSTQ